MEKRAIYRGLPFDTMPWMAQYQKNERTQHWWRWWWWWCGRPFPCIATARYKCCVTQITNNHIMPLIHLHYNWKRTCFTFRTADSQPNKQQSMGISMPLRPIFLYRNLTDVGHEKRSNGGNRTKKTIDEKRAIFLAIYLYLKIDILLRNLVLFWSFVVSSFSLPEIRFLNSNWVDDKRQYGRVLFLFSFIDPCEMWYSAFSLFGRWDFYATSFFLSRWLDNPNAIYTRRIYVM